MVLGKDIANMVQWEIRTGAPVIITDETLGQVTITPQSHVLAIRWPHGGWVWNRCQNETRACFPFKGMIGESTQRLARVG